MHGRYVCHNGTVPLSVCTSTRVYLDFYADPRLFGSVCACVCPVSPVASRVSHMVGVVTPAKPLPLPVVHAVVRPQQNDKKMNLTSSWGTPRTLAQSFSLSHHSRTLAPSPLSPHPATRGAVCGHRVSCERLLRACARTHVRRCVLSTTPARSFPFLARRTWRSLVFAATRCLSCLHSCSSFCRLIASGPGRSQRRSARNGV